MAAWLNGQPAADDGIRSVADILNKARSPLLLVDAIDVAGAAAALDLAQSCGASLDHARATGLAPLQEQGLHTTMPGEAYGRADAVLVVGPLHDETESDEALGRLTHSKPGRSLLRICDANGTDRLGANHVFTTDHLSLHESLSLLKTRLEGKPVSASESMRDNIDKFLEALKAAKYGVALISPGQVDDLTQFALMALVDTLSQETRWMILPVGVPAGQSELVRMSLALTGLPPPIQFVDGRAQHDPWLYGATNTVTRGETDLAVWISSSRNPPPSWLEGVKNIVVISAADTPLTSAAAQIEIGVAGVDYPAIIEPSELGAFTHVGPQTSSGKPSAAAVLNEIRAHVARNNKEAAA